MRRGCPGGRGRLRLVSPPTRKFYASRIREQRLISAGRGRAVGVRLLEVMLCGRDRGVAHQVLQRGRGGGAVGVVLGKRLAEGVDRDRSSGPKRRSPEVHSHVPNHVIHHVVSVDSSASIRRKGEVACWGHEHERRSRPRRMSPARFCGRSRACSSSRPAPRACRTTSVYHAIQRHLILTMIGHLFLARTRLKMIEEDPATGGKNARRSSISAGLPMRRFKPKA